MVSLRIEYAEVQFICEKEIRREGARWGGGSVIIRYREMANPGWFNILNYVFRKE